MKVAVPAGYCAGCKEKHIDVVTRHEVLRYIRRAHTPTLAHVGAYCLGHYCDTGVCAIHR